MPLDDVPVLIRLDSLEQKANRYCQNHTSEKVYVHFDKPFYVLGEDSWYKAYVVRDTDLSPTDLSSVLYVDWINPWHKVIKHQRLKIENGAAVGDFKIDKALAEGVYTVRAYTNWMRNEGPEIFYSKTIEVFNLGNSATRNKTHSSKIDLQFLPEGGTLVAGIMSKIAFKAIDVNGKGVQVKGRIVDEQNNFVTNFQSVHNGMGVLPLIADLHKSYKAILQTGEFFSLPLPSVKGFAMGAANMNNGRIQVRIQASKEYESSGVYLIGRSRGSVYYKEYIRMNGTSATLSILKDSLPEGIFQLTLLNQEGIPQCERMLFIRTHDRIVVKIEGDKAKYSARDSIALNFIVSNMNGTPIETSLSVSVTDAEFMTADNPSENIWTRLLLQSDLKGNIESPAWYFESQGTDRTYALDLIMLTHGWSRYNWGKIPEPGTHTVAFMPEKGIILKGQILEKGRPVADTPFTVKAQPHGNEFFNIYESDSLGRFSILQPDFSDTTTFSWRVMSGRKGKVQQAEIRLDTIQDIPPVAQHWQQPQVVGALENEFNVNLLTRFLRTGVWNEDNTRILDELVVIGERTKIAAVGANAIQVKPDELDIKTRLSTAQFISRYSLVSKTGSITINGYLEEGDPYTILNAIPIEQIDYVIAGGNIHDGYGISIGTKNIITQLDIAAVKQIVRGYDSAREFYQPKYASLDALANVSDNRITLFWNPNVATNKDGKASVSFYNTDITQELHIVVEGIATGIPFSAAQNIGKSN